MHYIQKEFNGLHMSTKDVKMVHILHKFQFNLHALSHIPQVKTRSSQCKMQIARYRLQNVDHKLQTEWKMQTADLH